MGSLTRDSQVVSEHSTVIPEVSIAAENLVYIRRSAEKKKDKGKGIMTEPEPEKKTKKQLEQERLGHEEAINKAGQEKVVAKDYQAHVINLSDPTVLRYHAQLNRPYSVAEVRKNMVMADGSSKNYKIFSEMLDDFDRHNDVLDLHRLVKSRYMTSSLEGYDLMLWEDLKILFQPKEEDEV
ncbi:hypothetical protein Tco_0899989 [Tanacetum coccineum]